MSDVTESTSTRREERPSARKRPITKKGGGQRNAGPSPRRHSTPVRPKRVIRPRQKNHRKEGSLTGVPVRKMLVEAIRAAWAGETRRYGVGAFIAVVERQGAEGGIAVGDITEFRPRPGERPKTAFLARADPVRLARMLGGLAHPDRVRLATAITMGARTHRDLSEATRLKTGPLYHHVRELERAELLRCAVRNVHELTELGRLVLLVCTVLANWDPGGKGAWRIFRLRGKAGRPA